MDKEEKEAKAAIKEEKEAKVAIKEEKIEEKAEVTHCYVKSRADFNIPVTVNNAMTIIPPFGKIKTIKEQLNFDAQFARYLTIVKL